jgi:glycine cleavage system aminomethyltransferase T
MPPLQPPDTANLVQIGSATAVWDYGDVIAEYTAIRQNAARIDLSAAGLIDVTGPDAFDLLQFVLSRDLEFVTPEQSLISLILDDTGRPLDVVTAYHVDDGYRLETAIGRGPDTLGHLTARRDERGFDAELELRGSDVTTFLVEGPRAAAVLEETVEPDLGALPLSGLMEVEFAGAHLIVSRSGFTGEYGYKLFVPAPHAPAAWDALGAITPVGLGALEIAMLEVRQPVLHREIDGESDALEAGYSWLMDITKEEFHGRDAVESAFEAGTRSRVIGWAAPSLSEPVPAGTAVTIAGERIGTVVHSVFSPGRKELIGLARLRPDLVAPGIDVTLGSGESPVAAQTIAAPYVIPESWKDR